jgi:NAD+ synthase (glutamine-hydrolysing)
VPQGALRLSLAQINPTVGDLAGNAAKIAQYVRRAEDLGSDLVVFPELCLTGYPPEDLLLQPSFIRDAQSALKDLAAGLPPHVPCVIGTVEGRPGELTNAAAVVMGRRVRALYRKRHLPNYGVFDEKRYFVPGDDVLLLRVRDRLVGITVCEDIWVPRGPGWQASRRGASLLVNISASPYHAGKINLRTRVLRDRVKECRTAVAYANLVGGQDELVFDGGSLVLDEKGRIAARAPQFEEALLTTDLDLPRTRRSPAGTVVLPGPEAGARSPVPENPVASLLDDMEEIYTALVLGTRDYLRKNGFSKAVIGLSGGIDSALVACVAVDALGKENVAGVTLPSRFNSTATRADAEATAANLGIPFHTVPIEPVVHSFLTALAPLFAGRPPDITEENLQARVRGTLLMALSNKFGWIVLTTGNKSETSVGYSTLYGDTAGGFAVIKDIPKTLVYRLSRWRTNRAAGSLIPESVFTRPPTAELRENQTDQDTLPPYDLLDRVVGLYVEENKGMSDIVKTGVEKPLAQRVARMVDAAEYKRRQSPPGIKITPRAFGRDRRMPIVNRYRHE